MITALAGGVGAAKFLSGLIKLVNQKDLSIIVNTGDDIEMHGLHVSADLDIIAYTLAGIVDEQKGWGIREDTFNCLESLKKFNVETWFNLGDKDFATHLYRTCLLREGNSLTEATRRICQALKVEASIMPMTNDKFETRIVTMAGIVHFEEFMVKRGGADEVLGVEFYGAEAAKPAPGVIESIENAEKIIICPSNPVVSIGTILSVKGIREALRRTKARRVAISPIVANAPIKGPADKLLKGLGHEVSAFSVAKLYADFLDTFVLDEIDSAQKDKIQKLGLKAKTTNTIMRNMDDKIQLAKTVLEI
jgi:LPPG:FO 2-phospho-L-lactate transferase